MTRVRCQITTSLDGYVAGPNQSHENPLGEGGMRLHQWAFATDAWQEHHGREGAGERSPDSQVIAEGVENVGAYLMGRRMFAGPGEGPWDAAWRGWWDEEPPFHAPVFVLTHHVREPLEMEGGTTFHFVTGVEAALAQAREAAGGRDVMVAGGAATVRQVLAAGQLDELYLHIAPVLLGGGERLLDDVGDPQLEIVKTVGSPTVTHIQYRVVR